MDYVHSIIVSPVVSHLIMTFLHSLWQGAIIAGLLWCLLHGLQRKSDTRYTLSLLALAALIVSMFFTYAALEQRFIRESEPIPQARRGTTGTANAARPLLSPAQIKAIQTTAKKHSRQARNSTPAKASTALRENVTASSRHVSWPAYMFLIWLGGACLMLARMFAMIYGAFRLRSTCILNVNEPYTEECERLKRVLSITRHVALGFSTKVVVPCTVGLMRPMIILPAALAGMDAQAIESVLLHELAHIKRLDWLVNIIQMLLESILFFNPAVWWISHQIRIEREAACDSYVVTHTQKPGQYAKLLLRFAAASSHPVNAVALALNGSDASSPASGGSLSERIRRLIVPGYRPNVHPGIVPVLLTLITLAFCGVGAYKASSATLRYFGRDMTPQQRAETVHALKKEYHSEQGRQGDLPEDQWLHIKGRIVTSDGLPLPQRTYQYSGKDHTRVDADLRIQTGISGSYKSIAEDGTFDFTVRQSRFILSVTCKGYATQHSALEYDPGTRIENLEILVSKGYTASIRFVDQDNRSIPAVKLTGGYPSPPKYGSYHHSIEQISNEHGIVRFDNVGDALMSLSCQAPGYARASQSKIHLAENEIRDWVLKPATLSEIQITDRRTGKALKDARIYVNGSEFGSSFGGKQGETKTDASGRAVLDSLLPAEQYLVMIRPEGMQRQYFNIRSGESIHAEFEPIKPIKGRIVGALSRLSKDDKGLYLRQTNTYHMHNGGSRSGMGGKAYVNVISDQEAVFQVDDYYAQEITLRAADQEYTVDVDSDEDMENIVFNLSPQEINTAGTRRVSFTFNSPTANPIRAGSQFKLLCQERGSHYSEPHSLEIIDGYAETYLHLPVNLHWEPLAGTNLFFKAEHKTLNQDRDYHFDIDCHDAGSVFGVINVPREFQYESAYMHIEFLNRDNLFQRYGFLPDDSFNITSQAQTKFMFGPLPLSGRYQVSFACKNVYMVSDEIQLTDKQPLCELSLPWPQETVTLRGRILDQAGVPAAKLEYRVSVKAEQSSRSFSTQTTNAKGEFECANVNAAKNLAYSILVMPNNAPWFESSLKASEAPVSLKLKQGQLLRGVLKDHAGNIRPNAEFHLWPSPRLKRTKGYHNQTVQTDDQGRFQTYLGNIDYIYHAGRRLGKNRNGHFSYQTNSVGIRPGKDQDVTILIDSPAH